MKDKELLRLLQKSGWKIDRINGSHYILVKDSQTVSLPVHGNTKESGTKVKVNAGASPQGA